MSDPQQHFFTSDRLQLSYWAWGDEAAPPLVLVHGLRDHARSWERVAEELEGEWRVIALDMRGHGDSEWSRGGHYGWSEFMLDLVALIDALGGRASVVGHSVGGGVALFAAGVFPERFARVVAIEGVNPWLYDERPPGPERMRAWADEAREWDAREPRVYASLDDALARLREVNPRLAPDLALHVTQHGTRAVSAREHGEGAVAWKYDPYIATQLGLDVRPEEFTRYWAGVECPVLHLVGDTSALRHAMMGQRPIADCFRDARTQRIERAGHWVHHDQLEATLAALRAFLEETPAR